MKRLTSVFFFLALALNSAPDTGAQPRQFFVDGFHGGVYGHYPLKTYTDYMSDQLEAHPDWSICLEIEPETWDSVAVRTPAALDRFRKYVEAGRVEFTNPAYAQPYMYNVLGESIIRQMDYGIRKIRQYFPDATFLTYAVEEPCFTSCLPGVLGGFGFKYASTKCPNTCWGGYAAGFGSGIVEWTGPDGSVLLAAPRYACEGLGDTVWETRGNGRYPDFLDACEAAGVTRPVGMCYQDAGWTNGPWLGDSGAMKEASVYTTWREYFAGEPADAIHEVYRMSQEDVCGGLVWGSQVLQRLSQQVRRAENKILMTEKTAALLKSAGAPDPEQALLDEAWRTLLLSEHHDCWIVPYNGLHRKGTWADHVALWTASSEENCDRVLSALADAPEAGDASVACGVVNTAAFARSEVVSTALPAGWETDFRIEDAEGRGVPYLVEGGKAFFRAETPALGIARYTLIRGGVSTRIVPETRFYGASAGPVTVAGGNYTLTLSPAEGGMITSLRTADGRECVDRGAAQGLNQLKGWFYKENVSHSSAEEPAVLKVTTAAGLMTRISVFGKIAGVPFVQTVTLEEGSRRIGFELSIDWKKTVGIGKFAQKDAYNNRHRAFYDTRYTLNVLFPVSCESPALFKDAPFDVCESRLEDTYFDRWDGIKHNVILDWVDLCGRDGRSFALFSDHTTSYGYGPGDPLTLTVQFSGNGLWGRNYTIDGPTRMRYAIVPHTGRWDEALIQEECQAWNEPLIVLPGAAAVESLLDLSGTGYAVSALTAGPDGYLLRLYNASGDDSARSLRLSLPAVEITEVDLLGAETARPAWSQNGDAVLLETSIPRFGIKTFRIR